MFVFILIYLREIEVSISGVVRILLISSKSYLILLDSTYCVDVFCMLFTSNRISSNRIPHGSSNKVVVVLGIGEARVAWLAPPE